VKPAIAIIGDRFRFAAEAAAEEVRRFLGTARLLLERLKAA
jgi:hypothetical protein